jgi:hypothetical protein
MQYALLINNTVVNVIEADAEFAAQLTGFDLVIQTDGTVGIGFTYDGSVFTAPVQPPIDPPPAPILPPAPMTFLHQLCPAMFRY